MYKQFVAVTVLLFACVHVGNALQCYECVETNAAGGLLRDPDCEDPFQNKSKITTCPRDKPYCGKFKVDMDGTQMTSRSCETTDGCDGIAAKHCTLCSTDLCNSAFAITVPSISFVILLASAFRLL